MRDLYISTWQPQGYPISDYPYLQTTFDKRSRPTLVQTPDGQNPIAETIYAYSGYSTTITDPDGAAKTETRDHLGRIIEVVDHPDSGDIRTTYDYNAAGDLEQVTNALGHVTSMTYNSLGRKTHMDDPDMGSWDYQYDANGNMTLQTDAKGQRIQFGYDALNRIQLKDYLDTAEPSVTYQYDGVSVVNGIGQLHQMTNGAVTTAHLAYDQMGRPKEMTKNITGTGTRTTLWDYDYSGKVTRLTYPHTAASSVFHVDYAFHPGTSLLHTATGSDGTTYANVTDYEPNTKIGRIDFGNGAYTDYTYDGWSQRLTGIQTIAAAGATAQDRQYTYSPAGDITVIDDLARVETYYYSYDKMHRLKSETTSTGSLGVTPAIMEMRYEDPDHIHAASSVVHKGVTRDYAYDPNGNMESGPDLTDPMAVVTRNLTFNADNLPTTVVHPVGGTISLIYDGEGNRAKKIGNGRGTYYFSNEFELIDDKEIFYIFAGNLRVAMVKDSQPVYFHKDHLGSSTAMTDDQGNIIETGMYMPFGGKRGDGGGISASSYKFTDQELDAESGLYNYDARLYDPIVGRFASSDPTVQAPFYSQSFNRYAYCFNNPLIYVDPTGYEGEAGDAAGDADDGTDGMTCDSADENGVQACVNDQDENCMAENGNTVCVANNSTGQNTGSPVGTASNASTANSESSGDPESVSYGAVGVATGLTGLTGRSTVFGSVFARSVSGVAIGAGAVAAIAVDFIFPRAAHAPGRSDQAIGQPFLEASTKPGTVPEDVDLKVHNKNKQKIKKDKHTIGETRKGQKYRDKKRQQRPRGKKFKPHK